MKEDEQKCDKAENVRFRTIKTELLKLLCLPNRTSSLSIQLYFQSSRSMPDALLEAAPIIAAHSPFPWERGSPDRISRSLDWGSGW